jgi:serine/threonine protein kinase
MEELNGQTVCPRCGFDPSRYAQPAIALKGGTILRERYYVGKVLGQGGFGITYVGFDLLLNIKVAIKEYFPSDIAMRNHETSNEVQWTTNLNQEGNWKNGCASFLKEARKMAKIDSIPNIVRVRDTFEENRTAYIVMDYVEGTTLKAILQKKGILPYRECISLLAPLIRSLGQVHQQGIIHRDISPDNIMIEPNGNIHLLDLGAAKDLSTVKQGGVSQLVTKKGFSPPEQYMESGTVGSWTDVYAMCSTIYYCITGKMVPDAMDRLAKDSLDFKVPVKEPIPQDVMDTLRAGLSVRIESRIPSMEALLNRLSAHIAYSETTDLKNMAMEYGRSHETPALTPEQKKKKLLKWLIPTISGAAAAVIVVLLVILKPWRVTIEQMGCSNSNMLNDGGYEVIMDAYEYYLDQNGSLHVCPYDEEEEVFDYSAETVIEDSENSYINVGQDKIYFVQTDSDGSHSYICRMDYDGSNVEQLYGGTHALGMMQYVLLSNKKEYLYFMEMETEDTANVVRLDLKKMVAETVLDEDLFWYNVYGDALYYTKYENEETCLYRSDFSGKKEKLLRADELFGWGFIEDDEIFLYSYDQNSLVGLDLDGNQVDAIHDVEVDDSYYMYAYADGWIYYMSLEDGNLHRVRKDGTGDDIVVSGIYAVAVCYDRDLLWIAEGQVVNGETLMTRTSLATKDGSTMAVLVDADINQTESGILYRYENGEITITGYVGNDIDVGIPYTIDDCSVTNIEDGAMPSGHNYYLYAEEEELTYEWDEAGTGYVITGYTGDLTSFMIPESISGHPVTEIGEEAFEGSDIQSVAIPRGVTVIRDWAFSECESLSYVGLPEGLITIEMDAFLDCTSLTDITLPSSLREIGSAAFLFCNLTKIDIPAGVEQIGNIAFVTYDSVFKEMTIDESNPYYTVVDNVLFTKDMETLVAFPDGITGSYTVPDGVKTIGDDAFYWATVSEVVLPDSVTDIGMYAFAYAKNLENITIPESVETIGANAFAQCDSLESITIGKDCIVDGKDSLSCTVYYYD